MWGSILLGGSFFGMLLIEALMGWVLSEEALLAFFGRILPRLTEEGFDSGLLFSLWSWGGFTLNCLCSFCLLVSG
jgi:hypothetical protein